jgi:hypothetical protein
MESREGGDGATARMHPVESELELKERDTSRTPVVQSKIRAYTPRCPDPYHRWLAGDEMA